MAKDREVTLSEQPTAKAAAAPTAKEYDADEFRDRVRQKIAYFLLSLLSACALLVAICLIWLREVDGAKDIAMMLFTPLLTAVSSILGFYFGEKVGASRKQNRY
jgi:amino acid permease